MTNLSFPAILRKPCDCTHAPEHHDPLTGACLRVNPTYGPCPCHATPASTRVALRAAFEAQKVANLAELETGQL